MTRINLFKLYLQTPFFNLWVLTSCNVWNNYRPYPNHFADIYSELYQKHDLGEEFSRVQESIVLQVDPSLLGELDRVNEKTVFEALTKLKSGKSDPSNFLF